MKTLSEILGELEVVAAVRPGHLNETRTVGYATSKHLIDPDVFARILQVHFDLTEEDVARLVRFDDSMTLEEMYEAVSEKTAGFNETGEEPITLAHGRWFPPYCHEFLASLERLARQERRTYRYTTRVADVLNPNAIAPWPFVDLLMSSFRKTEEEVDQVFEGFDSDTTLRELYVELRGPHLPWLSKGA